MNAALRLVPPLFECSVEAKSLPDPFKSGLTACAHCGATHVRWPASERTALLSKLSPAERVKRLLATPQWRGSSVTETMTEVTRLVPVEGPCYPCDYGRGRKPGTRLGRRSCAVWSPSYKLVHPGGAVALLYADPEVA